jgi:hypothetical protein
LALLDLQNLKNGSPSDMSKSLPIDLLKQVAIAVGIDPRQIKRNLIVDFKNDWSNPILQDVLQAVNDGTLNRKSTLQDVLGVLGQNALNVMAIP